VNAPGLIDAGYRGEIKILLLNTDRSNKFAAERGNRIAQLVVVECSLAIAVWAESLDPAERGEDGFGSSGLSSSANV
jgi:dUTP pyrophosphatase